MAVEKSYMLVEQGKFRRLLDDLAILDRKADSS